MGKRDREKTQKKLMAPHTGALIGLEVGAFSRFRGFHVVYPGFLVSPEVLTVVH